MTIETEKQFRFGVVENGLKSLSFKINRNREGCYLICREQSKLKHSFHESGIHRYARDAGGVPRAAIESTELQEMFAGEYSTVARVLFTTEMGWVSNRGGFPADGVALPAVSRRDGMLVSIGYTPHHPSSHYETDFGTRNVAIMKVSDEKYLTATISIINISTLIKNAYEHHTPHEKTKLVQFKIPVKGSTHLYDHAVHFRSKLNTYFLWVHHNIPKNNVEGLGAHEFAKALGQAAALQSIGIKFGPQREDIQRRRRERLGRPIRRYDSRSTEDSD